jgi:RimJ/RimL family protein N-acetyltransferase
VTSVGDVPTAPDAKVLGEADLSDLVALLTVCRAHSAPHAFPADTDVAWLLAEPESRGASRCWRDERGELVAFAMAQQEFGNVLFDVHPRARALITEMVVETVLAVLAESDATSADTPLESDDPWRHDVLLARGFVPTGDDVVHLRNDDLTAYTVEAPPADVTVASNADDLDGYVSAHRAAFSTTYLTRARRESWSLTDGYDPAYDLALRVDGDLAAFAVTYLRGTEAEVGVVGVVPHYRGRGLARLAIGLVLARVVGAGATSAWLSTSSTNVAMLAVAEACGFREFRRTTWWRRSL